MSLAGFQSSRGGVERERRGDERRGEKIERHTLVAWSNDILMRNRMGLEHT